MNSKNSFQHNWESIIQEQIQSGFTQKEFCAKHNITSGQFGYHKGLLSGKKRVYKKKDPLFSAIQIQKTEPKAICEIKIILPNGFQCLFPSTIDPSQIKTFIGALLSC